MLSISTADIISSLTLIIGWLGLLNKRNGRKSRTALMVCCLGSALWGFIEAAAYLTNGRGLPDPFLYVVNYLSYAMSGIVVIGYAYYCQELIREKEEINPWVYRIPILIKVFSLVFLSVRIFTGQAFQITDGNFVLLEGIPLLCSILDILVVLYLPLIVVSRKKQLGMRTVLLIGCYGLIPFFTTLVSLLTGCEDYTVVGANLIMLAVCVLVQNNITYEEQKEYQRKLEASNEDQEAQLEEIRALNLQLEENQIRLEEAATKQEEQILEITELNGRLQQEQDDQDKTSKIIDALSASYLNVFLIDIENKTAEIVKLDGYVTTGLDKSKVQVYPYAGICGKYISERVYSEDKALVTENMSLDHILQAMKEDGGYDFKYRVWEKEEIHYYQGRYRRIGDRYFVCGFQNIDVLVAEEEQQKQEMQIAKENAEAANTAKTSFLFSMSHDIRTPMNAIIGFRDLLEKNQEDPEKRADYLAKIRDSSNVLLSIINNVLEMARIEKGTIEIEENALSLEQFNDELYNVFDEMMKQKGLNFTRRMEIQHPYVYCDSIKLHEVMSNILSNSYKYTNPGGAVYMELKEIPSDRAGYAFYQTTISDTGIGMSEEFLPHLYEEFAREYNTTDRKVEGTGLGMPIVKRLVELMNGTIEVESKQGKGTTFVVILPLRIAEGIEQGERSDAEPDSMLFNGKRILLAEDNDLNAEIATAILEENGFVIERAEDGVICCEKMASAEAGYYDVILMDIQMPNRNGYEATRQIRAMADTAKAKIPILAMTANAFEEDKRAAFRAGMNGHLAKPIDVRELMKELARVLS